MELENLHSAAAHYLAKVSLESTGHRECLAGCLPSLLKIQKLPHFTLEHVN
jgi:hypothetical protein